MQPTLANKYYSFPNINITSEMSSSTAILLLLYSNVLMLSRPLVPSRMVGAVSQKLNFVSLQTPLLQWGGDV